MTSSGLPAAKARLRLHASTIAARGHGDPPGASHFDFGAGWTATGKAASVRVDSGIEDGAEYEEFEYDPETGTMAKC